MKKIKMSISNGDQDKFLKEMLHRSKMFSIKLPSKFKKFIKLRNLRLILKHWNKIKHVFWKMRWTNMFQNLSILSACLK